MEYNVVMFIRGQHQHQYVVPAEVYKKLKGILDDAHLELTGNEQDDAVKRAICLTVPDRSEKNV